MSTKETQCDVVLIIDGDVRVKKSRFLMNSWRKRYVRLNSEGKLEFYRNRKEYDQGKIRYSICLSKKCKLKTFPSHKYGFSIDSPEIDYIYLSTSDSKSMTRWWKAISTFVSQPTTTRSINQRDLGVICKGRILRGVLYRGSMQFNASKIKTVIDLRRPEISQPKPSEYYLNRVRINLVPSTVGARLFRALPLSTSIPALFSSNRTLIRVHIKWENIRFLFLSLLSLLLHTDIRINSINPSKTLLENRCEDISRRGFETCWSA